MASGPPATLVASARDILGLLGVPTNAAHDLLQRLLKRRADQAREILLDELRHGEKTLAAEEAEEVVAVLLRYARAVHEGAARLNLRLMAQAVAGQARAGAVRADEFLTYADTLAGLRREEIVYLGALYRHWSSEGLRGAAEDERMREAHRLMTSELMPVPFADPEEFAVAAAAIVRTGLLSGLSLANGATIYKPTRLLLRLCSLAPFEAATKAEPA